MVNSVSAVVLLSVSIVKEGLPGSCWMVNLDNCSGVPFQQRNASFRLIGCHWPTINLVGFPLYSPNPFQARVLHSFLFLFFEKFSWATGLYPIVFIVHMSTPTRLPSSEGGLRGEVWSKYITHCRDSSSVFKLTSLSQSRSIEIILHGVSTIKVTVTQ